MTIAHQFEYVRPETVAEAVAILAEHGERARVLAGGTDLVPWMRDDAVHPDVVVDVKHLPGLRDIEIRSGTLHIGSLVTFSRLADSEVTASHAPVLVEAAHTVGSIGIRNRATLAGNICSAVPSLDGGPPLLVYDAVVRAVGSGGSRVVPIGDWFAAPHRTVLGAGEIVTDISIPLQGRQGGCYVKLSRYRGEDLAQAAVAVLALPNHRYRIAFGAVGPIPVRAPAIEALLDGKELDAGLIAAAKALVDDVISPITDVRATARYRAHMCRIMLGRGLETAVARLHGVDPPYGKEVLS
jgi:carbon-monoxide dehydrogenase medium subunit